ncbi:hypothetical protein HCH52_06470 [Oscillospiraceae bacterium HV4-5-C5C]|nr:hypothetical protein [Oscillospiraceae bacterium HV4-5-C5C]
MSKLYTALPLIADQAQGSYLQQPEDLRVIDRNRLSAQDEARMRYGADPLWCAQARQLLQPQRQPGRLLRLLFPPRRTPAPVRLADLDRAAAAAAELTAYVARKPLQVSLFQPYKEAARATGTMAADYLFRQEDLLWHSADILPFLHHSVRGKVSVAAYCSGICDFCRSRGISLSAQIRNFSWFRRRTRSNFRQLVRFLQQALQADIPVSFYLRDAGRLSEFKNGQWLTVVGMAVSHDRSRSDLAVLFDGELQQLSLDKWYYTALRGGAFCVFSPGTEQPAARFGSPESPQT